MEAGIPHLIFDSPVPMVTSNKTGDTQNPGCDMLGWLQGKAEPENVPDPPVDKGAYLCTIPAVEPDPDFYPLGPGKCDLPGSTTVGGAEPDLPSGNNTLAYRLQPEDVRAEVFWGCLSLFCINSLYGKGGK